MEKESTSAYYHLDRHYIKQPLSFGSFRLFQIGRLYCTPKTVIGEHAHINWFELTVATGGRGTVYTNGIGAPIERGDIYLSFPCDFHKITSDPNDPLKYDFFAFNTEDPALMQELDRIVQIYMREDHRLFRDDQISSLISVAIAEINNEKRYSRELLCSVFTHLLILLIRNFSDVSSAEGRIGSDDANALCYRLMHYIDTHIYTMTGLGELSSLTNYNYSYLSALFRRVTSSTLSEYYRTRRLETARLLILEKELSISRIAELLHYSSIYTFSRAFKDQYGCSPEQYRKQKAHVTDSDPIFPCSTAPLPTTS